MDACGGLELGARVAVAHLRGELGEPYPDAPGVPSTLHVQDLQDGGSRLAVAQPDGLLGFEPDLAQARDEALGVSASPSVGVAPAVPGAAQLLHEPLLVVLDESHELVL